VPENLEIYTKQRGFTYRQEKLLWRFVNNGTYIQLETVEIKEDKFAVKTNTVSSYRRAKTLTTKEMAEI
jgi:hypothetical protein